MKLQSSKYWSNFVCEKGTFMLAQCLLLQQEDVGDSNITMTCMNIIAIMNIFALYHTYIYSI